MSIEKLRPSFAFTEDRIKELQAVVPEAFTDGKINWETLHEALGDYIEDPEQEHFGLTWPGKRDARRLAAMPSKGTLVPQPGEGMNEETTRNIFIEGDNLEALKLLQKSYAGRVKLIYIDPPYNTGNDFIYPDDYSEPLESYLLSSGQVDETGHVLTTNTRASGRFHSNWLNLMYPRLLLARQLLQDDGVIFVSIDDHEVHNLRQMMSEIFGDENFIGQLVVQSNPRGSQSIRHLANVHEYIVIFAKQDSEFVMRGKDLSEDMRSEYKYLHTDGRNYRLLGLRIRGGAWRREDRPSLYFPIWIDTLTGNVSLNENEEFNLPVWPIKPTTDEEGSWRWSREKIAENIDLLLARQVNRSEEDNAWDILQIDFLESQEGTERTTKAKTIWNEKELNYQNGRTEVKALFEGKDVFDFPKPVFLLKKIVQIVGVGDNDIVLDFFAGSSTAAHAVLELNREDLINRKFIMVQLPEIISSTSASYQAGYRNIAQVSRERILRLLKKLLSETEGQLPLQPKEDLGVKCYYLSTSNFKDWQPYSGTKSLQLETLFDSFETPLVTDWKPNNLLTEILLLQGFPLDSRIISLEDIASNTIQRVIAEAVAHELFVCLDEQVNDETIQQLHLSPEDIFVCLDSGLSDESKIRLADQCNLKVI